MSVCVWGGQGLGDVALCWAVNEKPPGTKSALFSCFRGLCVCGSGWGPLPPHLWEDVHM